MVQMAKSTKHFELFLRRNPGTVRVSTENSKDEVILVRCAIFRPATAEFRITTASSKNTTFPIRRYQERRSPRYFYVRNIFLSTVTPHSGSIVTISGAWGGARSGTMDVSTKVLQSTSMLRNAKQKPHPRRKRPITKSARRASSFKFVGVDETHSDLSDLDGTWSLTYAQKFELICQLSLFAYQLKNNTEHVPRLLRTTACIRRA